MKFWQSYAVSLLCMYLAGCAGSKATTDYEPFLVSSLRTAERATADEIALSRIDSTASLDDLLVYAQLNNPDLKAAFFQWRAQVEKIAQANALPDPRITYAYFIREVETRVGPQKQRIGISQTLPWFGRRRLKGDVAAETANAARAGFERHRLALLNRVKHDYFEYAYLHHAVRIIKENVQLLTYLRGVIEAKYRAGSIPYASLIKIEVELDRVKDRLQNLEDLFTPTQARLNASLNRPVGAILPRPSDISAPEISVDDSMWVAWVQENNPELQQDMSLILRENAAIDLARKNYFPDLTIGVDYIDTGDALNPEMAGSGKDPLIAMLSLNIPLWRGKNKASVDEAMARHQAAISSRDGHRNQLLAQLEMTLYKFREAERKIKLYRESLIPRSEQSLNVTRSAFETGAVDFLDLIDAQRTLLEFELLLEREKANQVQLFAELEMLSGRPVE